MAKYHLYWRLDGARVPVDAKERGGGWGLLMALVKQDMESGVLKRLGRIYFRRSRILYC
jgi:hypothetical protein